MTAALANTSPLRLFWWRNHPNFGDALSRIVTGFVSGREVVHAPASEAEVFAVGSILQVIRRKWVDAPVGRDRPWIWGSGLLHFVPRDFLKNVQVGLVRGPVSAALLGIKADRFGDPGLLIADALRLEPEKSEKIGLVPHFSQIDDPLIRALADMDRGFELIDPRDPPEVVCQRIAACRHIYSSSLHGLITADAYGVPSTWTWPGDEGHLKYYDYAASIGRPLSSPMTWGEVLEDSRNLPDHPKELSYAEGIFLSKSALLETFPAPLRAVPNAEPV